MTTIAFQTRSSLPAPLEELRNSLGPGVVVVAGDPEYDEARRVWNGMVDRYPALIARCRNVDHVIRCITAAGEHDLPLAVRGGGHNVAGFGTCDDGIVIDLGRMRDVQLDVEQRTVRVGGGATWADVDRVTLPHGLAVPGGVVSTTGVAGLTLGGGQGWLRRTYGMTCDSLIAAEVVLADGRAVHASQSENAELLWALRGGGGNCGVVTAFEYRLHDAGPDVAFASAVYSMDDAADLLVAFREYVLTAPDEVNATATLWTIPEHRAFPASIHGRAVIILSGLYVGEPARGEDLLRPLRQFSEPLLDMSAVLPFVAVQQLFDPFFPPTTQRYYWKSLFLNDLGDDCIRDLVAHTHQRASAQSMIVVWALGGALARVPATATAVGDRDFPYVAEILATWGSAADSDANITWARALFTALEPHGSGKVNLNFPGLGEDGDRFVRAAFDSTYDRLRELKRRYDPGNLFRLNQNVVP